CLFEKYEQEGLKKCETKESQTWRHASGSKAANQQGKEYDNSMNVDEIQINSDIDMQSYEILNEELKKTENLLNKYKKEYEQNMLYTSNLTIQIKKLQQELNELSYKYQMLEE
ncbi:7612_t:CDS:2, partial [Entrophospora sp. SA101]